MTLNPETLRAIHRECSGRVKYKLGAKVAIGAIVAAIKQVDCSGYVRWLADKAGFNRLLPDGSQVQLEWCRANLRKLEKYSDVQYAKDDPNRVFIAFLSPKPGSQWPRHVWLVHMGKTMESYGGHGVGSRDWSHFKNCKECFELK